MMPMDATDLARWTRFAAKGGIGKCTAIQDCVAEGTEDLMFLKDDEITVLMHLPNQAGRYLGYCEGVVGHFEGAHVRFHGKLKRPVMTKRSSSAAPSPTPTISASPSPRINFAHLPPRDASPLRQSSLASGSFSAGGSNLSRPSRRSSSRATDRDTEIITDPFDLERLASRTVAPRNRKKSRSRSRERKRNGVENAMAALIGNANERVEEKEREEKLGAEELSGVGTQSAPATPDGTPSTSSMPSEDASPSSPRYAPVVPPPRTASKSQAPSRNNVRSAQALPSPPNSPPKSRKSEDSAASDGESSMKSGRSRRTRIVGDMPGLELFMSRNGGGVGSRSGSGDDSGAPSPSQSTFQDNAKEEKSNRRRTRLLGMTDLTVLGKQLTDSPPPSPLPPLSPMHATPSFSELQTSPYSPSAENQPDVVNGHTPQTQARKKSTDDEEKNRKRRTGIVGDWTLAVDSEGVVVASPSPMRTEFGANEKAEKVTNPCEHANDIAMIANDPLSESTAPTLPEPIVQHDQGAYIAPILDVSSQELQLSQEQEPEVSSLYDRGSLYSTSTSTQSHGLDESMSTTSGLNVDSSRFTALEDGGLGLGIGLTMLQDMVDAESGSESESDYGEDVVQADPTRSVDVGQDAGWSTPGREVGDDAEVPPTPRPFKSTSHPVDVDVATNGVLHVRDEDEAEATQDEGEEDDEPEWDDEEFYGDDIYDNYRYSRYSMMSKISKRKSRFSVMTAREPDSPQSMAFNFVPPIPAARERKDSGSSSLRSYPSPTDEKDKKNKHVPPPLNLVSNSPSAVALLSPTAAKSSSTPTISALTSSGEQKLGVNHSPQPSPLLHTNFPSPKESSSRATSLGTPLLSPVPSVSSFSSRSGASPGNSSAGAASALRQKLENERGLSPVPSPIPGASPQDDGFGKGIVVEDDDEIHVEVVSADQSRVLDETLEADNSRISMDSMASASVESAVPSVASNSTDVSREMRRIEADLASVLLNPSINSSTTSLPAGSDPRTPTATEYAIGLTQPLRLHDRPMQRPEPPHEQVQSQLQQLPPQQPTSVQSPSHQLAMPRPRALLTPEQALFRPHPGAPPPNPAVVSGQRTSTYGMPPMRTMQPLPMNSQQNTLLQTMLVAAAGRMGPNGVPRNTTIFGKTVVDLSNSLGPVAMVWSIDPFPPEPTRTNSPGPGRGVPRRSTTAGASPLSLSVSMSPPPTPTPPPEYRATPSPPMRASPSPQVRASPSPSPVPPSPGIEGDNRGSRVVPRANFFPQVGTPRPRSRSFSGSSNESSVSLTKERSSDDASRPTRTASYQSLKQASTPPSGPTSNRGSKAPSPLSLPQNHIGPGLKAPPSPLSRPPLSPVQPVPPVNDPPPSSVRNSTRNVLRKVASAVNVSSRSERPSSPSDKNSSPPAPPQPRRSSSVQAEIPSGSSPPSGSTSVFEKLRRISSSGSGRKHQRTVSQQSRLSSNSDTARSTVTSPPLVRDSSVSSVPRRSNSLKSKLSMSHLRLKRDAVPETQVLSPTTAPTTPVFEFDEKPETVHVQDAEFEMITPVIMRNSSEVNSVGSVHTRDERPSIQGESRSDSPAAMSSRSAGASRSPLPNGKAESLSEGSQAAKPADDTAQIEAHRTRELKWISAMSATPAAQARKNKKIRKLVLEGVPASVRYLVWAHLTDSNAKRIPGVYGQLGKRGKVAAAEAIERDAQRCFPDQAHLRDPKGPLVSLLQTYLTMVPDIEYQTSLAIIAGHMLLQSPEEDAFWTFVSMMDLHLRSYFSQKSVQMEADAVVFQKTVESCNPALAQKLFVDLGIQPIEICRPWFTSVFVANLPSEHINRVWDVYLCEGPPFLFRIAIAILFSCRSAIESTRDRNVVLSLLARPETLSLLPTNPDDLIESALAVKLKDDDIKKQRIKVEAQLRRQTHAMQRAAPMLTSHISLPRS